MDMARLDDRLDAIFPGHGAGVRLAAMLLGGLAAMLAWSATALASCLPVAGAQPGIVPAAFHDAALPSAGNVRLTFLGHSSFLIETPGGATVVTDYNGYVRGPEPPEVVTMNNAHSTHYTDYVEPEIEIVLRGWDPDGGVAEHDVTHRDLRIRNVPTNVREIGGARYNGNSIFVFEVASLCIAHLGHLHHVLTDVHLGELGMIDVLLVPVDGSYTMAQELMVEVIEQIRPPVIIPMHYFGSSTLGRFLGLIGDRYDVDVRDQPTITLSRNDLPYNQVIVLPGG
jgi:L-ascorbate metabolism protein UlaG (beta-lactamase superfamily)